MAEDRGHRLVEMFLMLLVCFLSLRVSPRLVGGLSLRLSPRLVGGLCSVFLSFAVLYKSLICGQGDDAGQQTTITQQPPHSDGTDYAMHGCIGSSNGRLKTSP